MIILAPMEGLLDFTLRDILTRAGGIDRCVAEFIRVTGSLLPERVFIRVIPELLHGGAHPRRGAGAGAADSKSQGHGHGHTEPTPVPLARHGR